MDTLNSYDGFSILIRQMPKAADKATISVVIPKEIHERLKKLAEEKDWSVSQTAKNLIVDALDRTEIEGKKGGLPND